MSLQRVTDVIKPTLLLWARETAGLRPDEAARKIGVKLDRLAAWESGASRPTVAQLRKVAGVYRRPLAAFFLAAPPARPAPLHDFRRLPTGVAGEPSAELLLQMRRARRRRSVAVQLSADLGREASEFPLRAALDTDPEAVAEQARAWIGISTAEQRQWAGDYVPLNAWIAALEARGVLVFQTGEVPLDEMRGSSLNERRMPVIVLNAKDVPRGRIFTLMHELAHLMLGLGGVCDPIGVDRQTQHPDERVEAYCNRVAGAILLPRDALLGHPLVAGAEGPQEWSDAHVRTLADAFAVSREAIVRRLLILDRTTEAFCDRKREEYLAQYRARAVRERDGSPSLFRAALRDNGREYTLLVFEALEREEITLADVSDYLGVRLKHLDEIADAAERAATVG